MSGNHGGARPGTGPVVRRIHLSDEAAQRVRLLLKAAEQRPTADAVTAYIESLITEAYAAYDRQVEHDAEHAND